MSEGLHGFADFVFYQYHFIGGPNDGEISNGFRPYFRLTTPEGAIYEADKYDSLDDYVQWIDDGTRKIELKFKKFTDPPTLSEEEKNLFLTSKPIQSPKRVCKFYDPHPGLLGCAIPIPEMVRIVANELNNTETTLEEAVDRIKAACPDGIVEAHEGHGMITLKKTGPYMGRDCFHSWRVIRFT